MGSAERQKRLREKRNAAGYVQLNIWVPAAAVPELQRAAELIRAEPWLAVARLVDTRTGKLRGLR